VAPSEASAINQKDGKSRQRLILPVQQPATAHKDSAGDGMCRQEMCCD